jgi:hypothetical protein
MDLRWYGEDINRARALAQELVSLHPDMIVTGGTGATSRPPRRSALSCRPAARRRGDRVTGSRVARRNGRHGPSWGRGGCILAA